MKATIIGGGIIGLSTALYLNREGWDVNILEKDKLLDNCSFGNMGYLSPSHFATLAQPGLLNQGILWMFDKKSPFYIRPEWSGRLLDWGLKFAKSCTAGHVQRSARPMLDLILLSKKLTSDWQKSGDLQFEYAEKGCIIYYQTEKYEKSELENVRMGRDLGLNIAILSPEAAQALEPDLKPKIRGGVWYKDDAFLHPNSLMVQLQALVEKQGVRIIKQAKVTGFQRNNGKVTALRYRPDGGLEDHEVSSDLVVLAAGAWSGELARMAGEHLPLMPGKGYSMTIDVAKQLLRFPCILSEAKVAISPWERQLRIGSTMEIGAINDKILYPRVQGILEAVPKYFPSYATDPAFQKLADEATLKAHLREKVWYGFRPLSADGLPYIGFAKHSKNLIIASGHAMLGISMAAATGKLVAELANGKATSIDIKAFDPGR